MRIAPELKGINVIIPGFDRFRKRCEQQRAVDRVHLAHRLHHMQHVLRRDRVGGEHFEQMAIFAFQRFRDGRLCEALKNRT